MKFDCTMSSIYNDMSYKEVQMIAKSLGLVTEDKMKKDKLIQLILAEDSKLSLLQQVTANEVEVDGAFISLCVNEYLSPEKSSSQQTSIKDRSVVITPEAKIRTKVSSGIKYSSSLSPTMLPKTCTTLFRNLPSSSPPTSCVQQQIPLPIDSLDKSVCETFHVKAPVQEIISKKNLDDAFTYSSPLHKGKQMESHEHLVKQVSTPVSKENKTSALSWSTTFSSKEDQTIIDMITTPQRLMMIKENITTPQQIQKMRKEKVLSDRTNIIDSMGAAFKREPALPSNIHDEKKQSSFNTTISNSVTDLLTSLSKLNIAAKIPLARSVFFSPTTETAPLNNSGAENV